MTKSAFLLILLSGIFSVSSLLAQAEDIQVLIYTSPDPWHNSTIPTAVSELKELGATHHMGITWTQQEELFTDDYLSRFSVLLFLHSTSRNFSSEQLECLQRFIQDGGGFVGIHGASVFQLAEEDPWFQGLVGYEFKDHPPVQTAVMTVSDKTHPSTMHLPDNWLWTDEWYNFKGPLSENLHVLLEVEESTYQDKKGMGEFHPISWYQEYDGGRSFYTALGHIELSYKDDLFLKHLLGGIFWAATGLGIVD